MLLKRISFIFIILFFFTAGSEKALAHATPLSYVPAPSQNLATSTPNIEITFSEHIEPIVSSISLLDEKGESVEIGKGVVDAQNPNLFIATLPQLKNGTYTVSWQVVSADDGHFTKGSYAFSIGKEAPLYSVTNQVQVAHLSSWPEATTIWIEILGQAILLGSLILLLIFAEYANERIIGLMYLGSFLVFLGALSYLLLKILDIGQGFLLTTSGVYALVRIAILAIFVILLKLRKNEKILLFLTLLMVLDRTRVSHAAATHFHPYLTIFIHFLHLSAKELWVGSLIAMIWVFLPSIYRRGSAERVVALSSFSRCINIVFAVISITGLYVIWLDLKSPMNLFTTEWGAVAIVLLVVTALMFGLRLFHQLWLDKKARNTSLTLSHIFMVAELLSGLALLFITSYIIIVTPPYPSDVYLFKQTAISQNAKVTLEVHPYESHQFLVTFADADSGAPLPIDSLSASLQNTELNIGPLTAHPQRRFAEGFVIARDEIPAGGTWKMTIVAKRRGDYDIVASFNLDYPKDIDTSRVDPDKKTFGGFEVVLILIALLTLVFLTLLYVYGRNVGRINSSNTTPASVSIVKSSLIGFGLWILLALIVMYSYLSFIRTDFQKNCEKNGDFWLQSVPLSNGLPLSSDTVTGCTTAIGQYHFAEAREYAYFERPSESIAETDITSQKILAGIPTAFHVTLEETKNGRKTGPVSDLTIEHDRLLHVIIIGADLDTFGHIHTEDIGPVSSQMLTDATFPFTYTFPKAGHYTIAVNYYIRAKQFVRQFYVDVTGNPSMSGLDENTASEAIFDGYDVKLEGGDSIKMGEPVKLAYTIEKDGKPVTDLEPYLAAAMHVGIINANLQNFIHTHGQVYIPGSAYLQSLFKNYVTYHNHFVPDHFGPKIEVYTIFPQRGDYVIFGEIKHHGHLIVTRFRVHVN